MTLSYVPVGTNGGVTIHVSGTTGSSVGGTIVGVAYYIVLVAVMTCDMINIQWHSSQFGGQKAIATYNVAKAFGSTILLQTVL